MIRTAIVEDNSADAARLKALLAHYTEENRQSFHVDVFQDSLGFLHQYQEPYDLIFMDIELPGINGMETARRLRKLDSLATLIFVTNMAQYALHGYEVNALDFVLKPVSYAPFAMKLKRAVRNVQRHSDVELNLVTVDGFVRISASQVLYVEVQKHYLTYHTEEGTFTVRETMKVAAERLAPLHFARCSNSYLVNLRHVTMVQENTVRVGQTLLSISRSRKADFLKYLASYLGGTV